MKKKTFPYNKPTNTSSVSTISQTQRMSLISHYTRCLCMCHAFIMMIVFGVYMSNAECGVYNFHGRGKFMPSLKWNKIHKGFIVTLSNIQRVIYICRMYMSMRIVRNVHHVNVEIKFNCRGNAGCFCVLNN